MGYIALVTQKVQVTKGGKTYYEIRNPGDPIPEADKWPNPGLWVSRGYIKPEAGTNVPRGTVHAPKPMRAVTQADLDIKAKKAEAQRSGAEIERGPGFIEGPIGAVSGVPLESGDDATTEGAPVEAKIDKSALEAMSKKDLQKLAKKIHGMAPSKRISKEDLIVGILASVDSKE